MISPEAVDKIKALAEEVCQREGCYFYDLEFSGNPKNRAIRIYIDCDATPVTVEQCANVSRGLSLLLDVQDLVPGNAYELEVSSPGLERNLREPRHYLKSVGRPVKVVLQSLIPGAEAKGLALAGILSKASDTVISLQEINVESAGEATKEFDIPYGLIKRAQTVFEIKQKDKKR